MPFGAYFANVYRREALRQARTTATRNASCNTSRTTAIPSVVTVTVQQPRSDPYSLSVSCFCKIVVYCGLLGGRVHCGY